MWRHSYAVFNELRSHYPRSFFFFFFQGSIREKEHNYLMWDQVSASALASVSYSQRDRTMDSGRQEGGFLRVKHEWCVSSLLKWKGGSYCQSCELNVLSVRFAR